jgi:hypothetical protein
VSCRCEHESRVVPRTRDEAVALCAHQSALGDLLENVVVDSARWMSVLRCRECGRYWAEDGISTGHVDLLFAYPIETDDPHGWLARASSLNL